MLTPRNATYADVRYMAERLRPADKAEVYAAGGVSPYVALLEGLSLSLDPMVGVDENDNPVCIGGVTPTQDPLVGCVWMLATTDIEKHKMSFLRRSRPWVEKWNSEFPVLTNCVDERNELHIKWLRWLGFVFICRHPFYGFEERPFLEFVRINHV